MGRKGRVITTMAGTLIIAVLTVFALVASTAGASDLGAPAAQATATATAGTGDTTGGAATATAGTMGGDATATVGTTGGDATALPNTGAESNIGLLFMGAAALLVLGVAVSGLLAIRRGQQQ